VVGRGVAVGGGVCPPPFRIGELDGIETGVGVGLTDGSTDGVAGDVDSDAPGVGDPTGSVGAGLKVGGGDEPPGATTDGVDVIGADAVGADAVGPPATSRPGWVGVTRPAASATVARTMFRRPKATTRRAR
jgi:hypothetical protein